MNTTSLYVLFLTLSLAVGVTVTTGPVQRTLLIAMVCSAIAAALTVGIEAAGNRAKRNALATSAERRRAHHNLR